MPRANRLSPLRGACYYYRRQSGRGRPIVADGEELGILLAALTAALRRSAARLYAFHIDSTQLHLVVRAGNAPLLPALGIFCHELTRRLNRRRGERGTLFAQRARVTVFQPESWLLPIARYVHSMSPPGVSVLSASSDRTYRAGGRMPGLTTTAILRALSSRIGRSLPVDEGYAAYFDAPSLPPEIHMIEHGSHDDGRILGDREFIIKVSQAGRPERSLDAPAASRTDERIRDAADRVVVRFHALCRRFLSERDAQTWVSRTTLTALRSKSRRMPLPLVRAMIADDVLARRLATRSDVERYFGLHSRSLAAGLRRRYRGRLVARFRLESVAAPDRIPDLERGSQRVDAELLEDVVAVVLDR